MLKQVGCVLGSLDFDNVCETLVVGYGESRLVWFVWGWAFAVFVLLVCIVVYWFVGRRRNVIGADFLLRRLDCCLRCHGLGLPCLVGCIVCKPRVLCLFDRTWYSLDACGLALFVVGSGDIVLHCDVWRPFDVALLLLEMRCVVVC